MIDKSEWRQKHLIAWDEVHSSFQTQNQPYYFNDWRGYARCYEDAQRGDERAGQWLAEFTRRLMS